MAFSAVFERQIAAKRPLTVVTGETRRAARRNEMLSGGGRAHLTTLSRSRGQLVAVGAGEFLSSAVVCVAECVTIRACVGAGGPVGLLLVADSTRSHLASRVGFTGGRVAGVAIVVGGNVRKDR